MAGPQRCPAAPEPGGERAAAAGAGAAVSLTAEEARALAERALGRVGLDAEEARTVAESLLDAELCGYPALGLARVLTIAEEPRARAPRQPVRAVHETAVSALLDASDRVGPYALARATDLAAEKARAAGFALVGAYNTYLTGRSGYYVEKLARAGLVALHFASTRPFVAAPGAAAPVLGTNPLAFGLPADPDPFVFDMSTSAIAHSEVVLAARLGRALPEGVAIDRRGEPTCDARAALEGAILTFGGHKGYGLSLTIQALGLLAGSMLAPAPARGFGFLFIVLRPELLVPPARFRSDLRELLARIRSAPRRPGANEIRIPSERAFRERARRLQEGIAVDRRLYEAIRALAEGARLERE